MHGIDRRRGIARQHYCKTPDQSRSMSVNVDVSPRFALQNRAKLEDRFHRKADVKRRFIERNLEGAEAVFKSGIIAGRGYGGEMSPLSKRLREMQNMLRRSPLHGRYNVENAVERRHGGDSYASGERQTSRKICQEVERSKPEREPINQRPICLNVR